MRIFFLALLSLCMVFAAPVFADPTPVPSASPAAAGNSVLDVAKGRLATMFTTGHADAAWFTDDFLTQVPASKVDEIVAQIVKALGAYKSVEFTPQAFVVHFENGTDNVLMHVNAAGKIDMLYFKPPSVASLDRALRTLSQLPGTVSYVIEGGRSQRAAFNASQRLAVGSTFKLAVLNALRDQVSRGKRRWSDVVPLDARAKSLPSGVFQTWPDGTPITLNPFLTTREMAGLKSTGGEKLAR